MLLVLEAGKFSEISGTFLIKVSEKLNQQFQFTDLIKETNECDSWSHPRAGAEEVKQKFEVSVVEVNTEEVAKELLLTFPTLV